MQNSFMLGKRIAVFLSLAFISIDAYAQEAAVSDFDNLFALKLSLNHNFLNYLHEKDGLSLDSNRPMDIGIGFGYKDFSFGFAISVPFIYDENYSKSKSFDMSGNWFFRDSAVFNGYIKYYSGFHNEDSYEVDLEILAFGFSGEYIFNKKHSLRGVYNLDRKQAISNGSFLLGGGVFFSSVDLDDGVSTLYKELHIGPNLGYSYTQIIKNDFFVNIVVITGVNGIKNDENISLGMHCLPKLSIGFHGKTWSANIFSDISLLISNIGMNNEYILTSGISGIGFSKRI